MWSLAISAGLLAASARAQVTASNPNGPTNPDKPEFYPIGAQVNQTSMSRLLTLNSVDDFCLYGPPEPGPDSVIGNVEPIVVAYCTKPRNNARLIPDGTIQSAHFIKTPLYVQIHGFWDGTRVNIPYGDDGGELDPHGAKNEGNPVGGNVTSNVEGKDVFYEEWMSFIGYNQFCLRICTAETANVTTALQCEHELDIMGCRFVMAIEDFFQPSTNGTFTSCEGEPAAPPGLYPLTNGSTSTFRQRYTGSYTDGAKVVTYTVGHTVTPTAPAFWPKVSNCVSYSTISNGVDLNNLMVTAAPVLLKGASASETASVGTTSMASTTQVTGLARPTQAPDNNKTDGNSQNPMTTDSQGNPSPAPASPNGNADGKSGASMVAPAAIMGLLGIFAGVMATF